MRSKKLVDRSSKLGKRDGVALVVTLLMLSVITFMAVAFLAVSRRERASVAGTLNQVDAQAMADAALPAVRYALGLEAPPEVIAQPLPPPVTPSPAPQVPPPQ